MSKKTNILIGQDENFDKLFLVKDYDSIKYININGRRDYNEQIIQQLLKFKKVEELYVHGFNDNDFGEIANLQSLNYFRDNSANICSRNFYISKNKENVIINTFFNINIDKVIYMLNNNIINITINIYDDNYEKICDNLPLSCKNVRIIIRTIRPYNKIFNKFKNFNLSNLPTALEKIDIIFKKITKMIGGRNSMTEEDKKLCRLIEKKFTEQIKIPFGCYLNIIFL